METTPTLEDWRGVDVEQIRRQLRMTVAERASTMVRISNRLYRAQARVRNKHDG
jgi:hypothetical protein